LSKKSIVSNYHWKAVQTIFNNKGYAFKVVVQQDFVGPERNWASNFTPVVGLLNFGNNIDNWNFSVDGSPYDKYHMEKALKRQGL
jgi:hypothetical protein